jgi:chromosome segregation ATPase
MDELIKLAITAIIGAVGGALTPILIARYSKSREERDSGLVVDYIKIADMTGAQLEKKINQINHLEQKVQDIQDARRAREIETQAERDELQARIQADLIETRGMRADYLELKKEVAELRARQAKDLKETIELREDVAALRAENIAAKNVIKKLLQFFIDNKYDMPELNGDLDKLGESVRGLVMRKPKE